MTVDMDAARVDEVNVLRRADEPAHFLWRGRLYAVRSVLAHWSEAERELWRVEASAGRTATPARFDLCLARPGGDWTLTALSEDER